LLWCILISGQKKHWKDHKEEHWRIRREAENNKDMQCGLCSKVIEESDGVFRMSCCGRQFHDSCDTLHRQKNPRNFMILEGGVLKNGTLRLCPSPDDCNVRIAPEENSPEEIALLRKWVAKNKAWAQFQLADRYYDGHGVEKSINKAEKLYESAANQGDTLAMVNLCHILFKQQKYTQFIYWSKKIANNEKDSDKHRAKACRNLASYYSNGTGETSVEDSLMWIEKSCNYLYGGEKVKSMRLMEIMKKSVKLEEEINMITTKKCASCNAVEQLPQKLLKCGTCKLT